VSKFRIVIFSSDSPTSLDHFLRRLESDLPEVEVAGILYEEPRAKLSPGKRIRRFFRLTGDGDFRAYVAHRIRQKVRGRLQEALDGLLRLIHSAPKYPNGPVLSLDAIIEQCNAKRIRFHLTGDLHDSASLQFTRGVQPELGVIYGTRILRPELFSIPARGSINIHKHKLPEYRGGGAPGIWELRDNQSEASVSVHRVLKEVDAGPILGEMSFPIEPFDTLESVGLKADLLAIDLLIEVLRNESIGKTREVPQSGSGTVYKGFQPHQIFAIEKQIQARRLVYKNNYSRPFSKLLLRTFAYPAAFLRNVQRRRHKRFPVVILFHHLITDRPKFMGLPTTQFAAHVRFLKKHYRIVSLPEAMALLKKGQVEEPTVALTFDDGYAENFLCLRAVAEREGVPISLFVCTQHVSDGNPFQHDLDKNELGFSPLTWDQIRYLDQHDVVIGSHTRRHFDCGVSEQEALIDEIVGSRDDLRRELGPRTVDYFAFPKGHPQNMSELAREISSKAYDFVFSACGGVNYGLSSEADELYRCSCPDSLWELELLLQGLLEFRKISASKSEQEGFNVSARTFAGTATLGGSSAESKRPT
jgi:peptidoglycan/xylan/chitin deacetylase (PgdA/CDA1 family)/folate-dependent phosphoribosylglycinamide formyltransferase PurN